MKKLEISLHILLGVLLIIDAILLVMAVRHSPLYDYELIVMGFITFIIAGFLVGVSV